MKPSHAEPAEQVIPIPGARSELAGRRMAAVAYTDGASEAETALCEVQPVAYRSAHAIMWDPSDELGPHTLNSRAVRIRPSPGSNRSMTSPRASASKVHFSASLIFSMPIAPLNIEKQVRDVHPQEPLPIGAKMFATVCGLSQ